MADSPIWTAVERLADRAASIDDLRAHRIHLIAARRLRALGRPVPAALANEMRASAACALTVPLLLRRVRAALDGPLVVIKGPEAAAHYPDPVLRPYGDIDLLVRDAAASQRALLAAGFFPIGDPRLYEDWLSQLRGSRVDVRSKSRVGKSDLGANAERIGRLLERLRQPA